MKFSHPGSPGQQSRHTEKWDIKVESEGEHQGGEKEQLYGIGHGMGHGLGRSDSMTYLVSSDPDSSSLIQPGKPGARKA